MGKRERRAPSPGTCEIFGEPDASVIVCGELCSVRDLYRLTDEYKYQRACRRLKERKAERRAQEESE